MEKNFCDDIKEIKAKLDTIINQNNAIKEKMENFEINIKNQAENKTTEEFLKEFMGD